MPKVSWDDIGGKEHVKQLLKEAVEWPMKVLNFHFDPSSFPSDSLDLTFDRLKAFYCMARLGIAKPSLQRHLPLNVNSILLQSKAPRYSRSPILNLVIEQMGWRV